jgi:hypothetical protein
MSMAVADQGRGRFLNDRTTGPHHPLGVVGGGSNNNIIIIIRGE